MVEYRLVEQQSASKIGCWGAIGQKTGAFRDSNSPNSIRPLRGLRRRPSRKALSASAGGPARSNAAPSDSRTGYRSRSRRPKRERQLEHELCRAVRTDFPLSTRQACRTGSSHGSSRYGSQGTNYSRSMPALGDWLGSASWRQSSSSPPALQRPCERSSPRLPPQHPRRSRGRRVRGVRSRPQPPRPFNPNPQPASREQFETAGEPCLPGYQ